MNPLYKKFINQFNTKNILVIGDVMLDEYIFGKITRMSPEAPDTPVILVKEKKWVLGGAANVAHNIATLGATAFLIGTVGTDEHGRIIKELLKSAGVKDFLVAVSSRPTTTKTRVFENHRQLTRIDQEKTSPIDRETNRKLLQKIQSLQSKQIDAVIISDYAKGVFSESTFNSLIKFFDRNTIIADFKPVHRSIISKIGAITPNAKEASEMTKIKIKTPSDAQRAARALAESLQTSTVITLGALGMTACRKKTLEIQNISPRNVRAIDVTGAGDTVTAALTLALASGADLFQAADLANAAASLAVTKVGTATVDTEELKNL